MKYLESTGPAKTRVIDVPKPEYGDDEILVRLTYTGICHSEHYPWKTAEAGFHPGHESVGIVEEYGKNVTGWKKGDRITGLGGGAFQDYIVMDRTKALHVPDNLDDKDAIVEPLACIMSACIKMKPETIGDTIAVVGCGYMGLGSISLLKAMGYTRIVAVDKRPEALKNAEKFGATETYTPDSLPKNYKLNWQTMETVSLRRDGYPVDIFNLGFKNVLEFTGTPDGLELAAEMVTAHGRFGIGGYHNDGRRTVDFQLWNYKAMTMINCHERRIEYEFSLCDRCLQLIANDVWKFKGVTNNIYTMDEFDKSQSDLETHANGYIKGAVKHK